MLLAVYGETDQVERYKPWLDVERKREVNAFVCVGMSVVKAGLALA